MRRRPTQSNDRSEHALLVIPGRPASPFLTIAEIAVLLRFDATAKNPERACWQWLRRNAVPIVKRGRIVLVERRILEAMLEKSKG